MDPYKIVHTILVTEKGTEMSSALGQYTFKVAKDANKLEVRAAVEALFSVKVKSVNVMNRMGKLKRAPWRWNSPLISGCFGVPLNSMCSSRCAMPDSP